MNSSKLKGKEGFILRGPEASGSQKGLNPRTRRVAASLLLRGPLSCLCLCSCLSCIHSVSLLCVQPPNLISQPLFQTVMLRDRAESGHAGCGSGRGLPRRACSAPGVATPENIPLWQGRLSITSGPGPLEAHGN